jgi:hypothetical protein
MKFFVPVSCALALSACSSSDNATPTPDASSSQVDASVVVDAPPGPPNAKVKGTWDLMSAGTTCGITFSDGFTATPTNGSDHNFTLTLNAGQIRPTLTCALGVADPTKFTCSNFAQAGNIPPNCNVSLSLTTLAGAINGTAVEISSTVQVASPNCGSALNCGPLPHVATGVIKP